MKFRLNGVVVKVPQAIVDGAVSRAVGDVLRESEHFKAVVGALMDEKDVIISLLRTSPAFKAAVESAVRAEVKHQAPGNPRIAAVIKEVQEHLDRYPAIGSDVGLQQAVGVAIFEYLQGRL